MLEMETREGSRNIAIYPPPWTAYLMWHKSNETDFLLTMNFILFTNQSYPLRNSSLGQLHSDGGVVSLFVAVLEGVCWNTIQLVGYDLLDIIQITKMAPFQVFLRQRNKNKSQGLRSGE